MNEAIALATRGPAPVADHVFEGRPVRVEARRRRDLHDALDREDPLAAATRLPVQPQLGLQLVELETVHDHVGPVQQLVDDAARDALG